MTHFVTDIDNTSEEPRYKLIFHTKDKDIFNAIQTFARRMLDREAIATNYEYMCTRTPDELAYMLATFIDVADDKAADKLRELGLEVTVVRLALELEAQTQLHWLNQPYEPPTEEEYESDTDTYIE